MDAARLVDDIHAAAWRIEPHVRRTPVQRARSFERGCEVWLKLENTQLTGSFKLRGVMNLLLALDEEERARGFVASSTGNHGAAAAHAAEVLGCPGKLVVPRTARPGKLAALRATGIELIEHGDDCLESELFARALAEEEGRVYLSPYNDPAVVAGQGTVALELVEQVPDLDAVFVAVGGGGLVTGIGCALRELSPRTSVVGASPERSPALRRALDAGRIVEVASGPTLSDATAGGLEAGSVTFELARELDLRVELVSEPEIAGAARRTILEQHTLVEGAAGAAVAAFLREADRWSGGRVAIVLCGANVGAEELEEIL